MTKTPLVTEVRVGAQFTPSALLSTAKVLNIVDTDYQGHIDQFFELMCFCGDTIDGLSNF